MADLAPTVIHTYALLSMQLLTRRTCSNCWMYLKKGGKTRKKIRLQTHSTTKCGYEPGRRPRLSDDTHGTHCAGEIAAVKNDVCGIGVAYDAKVAGIRILSGDITEAYEAAALNYAYQDNSIYSCSWGPADSGEVAEAPQGIILDAIKNGIKNGRNGTGFIFVFSSGNGGAHDDNCNFDGESIEAFHVDDGSNYNNRA